MGLRSTAIPIGFSYAARPLFASKITESVCELLGASRGGRARRPAWPVLNPTNLDEASLDSGLVSAAGTQRGGGLSFPEKRSYVLKTPHGRIFHRTDDPCRVLPLVPGLPDSRGPELPSFRTPYIDRCLLQPGSLHGSLHPLRAWDILSLMVGPIRPKAAGGIHVFRSFSDQCSAAGSRFRPNHRPRIERDAFTRNAARDSIS